MLRANAFALLCIILIWMSASAQDGQKKQPPKKLPPQVEKLLQLAPEDFIKRFDKNGDGKLSKDEAPPFLARAFDLVDKKGAGTLDRDGVAALQKLVHGFFTPAAQPKKIAPASKDIDKTVDRLLKQFDASGDGKIARAEAKGPLADRFNFLDQNKDGFLDRTELRIIAARMTGNAKGFQPKKGFGGPNYDFDAVDKNADGRLTKAELKGTPLANRFAEIDTDRNGMIDRREFEAFLERESTQAKKE